MTITLSVWFIPIALTALLVGWPLIFPYRPSGLWDIDLRGFLLVPVGLFVWLVFFAIMYFCK